MVHIERKPLQIEDEATFRAVSTSCYSEIIERLEKRIETAGSFDPDARSGPSFRMWHEEGRREAGFEIDYHDTSNEVITYIFKAGSVRKEGSKDYRDIVEIYTSHRDLYGNELEGEIFHDALEVSNTELATLKRIIDNPLENVQLLESLPRLP